MALGPSVKTSRKIKAGSSVVSKLELRQEHSLGTGAEYAAFVNSKVYVAISVGKLIKLQVN